jgi:NifU-like protein involved in Fe-S cluster formation
MSNSLYNKDILRLAASTAGLSRLPAPQGSAERRSPICGSRVTIDVLLDPAGAIGEFGCEVRACAMGQAATALLSARAVGLSYSELYAAGSQLKSFLSQSGPIPADWPELAIFEPAQAHPARHAAILLPFTAIVAAIEDANFR